MPEIKSTPQLDLTVRIGQAAKLLGVTPMTLRRWDKAGILQPRRMGVRGDRRYTRAQILEVLAHGLSKK